MNAPRARQVAVKTGSVPGMKPVLHITGLVLLSMSGVMLVPMLVDLYFGNPGWQAFAASALMTAGAGWMLIYVSPGALKSGFTVRQAFILTPTSWFSVAAVSALPFFFSDHGVVSGSFSNAFFESVSGITTTGATVISDLERAPPGVLLWRALLQWVGGIGIIATAIAILPALGIGGMQLFRTESSDRSEKAMPRVRQIALTIASVYVALTLLAALVYWLCGMSVFDAVAHALATISTGGFSTSDLSFGAWSDNGIQWFAIAFMLSGTVPFVVYVRFIAGDYRAFLDRQIRTLMLFLGVVVVALTAWLFLSGQYDFQTALRHAAFNVVSVVTTTGFASADYTLWGNAVVGVFFGLTFVGGCTGSTSGGIKIFRFEVLAVMLRGHFLRLIYPRGVFPLYYGERPLDSDVVGSVVAFFAVFFLCYAALTIGLMAFGLDFLTSASGAATVVANVGPGLGDLIDPAGNFSLLPDGAKWLLSLGMLLGRLELFTVLVLFLPRFWR